MPSSNNFSIISLLLGGLSLAMMAAILCHKFSIGLRPRDWDDQFIKRIHVFASTFSRPLLDGWEHCHLEISSSVFQINFWHSEQFRFQHSSIFCGIHHTLINVQSSDALWCHASHRLMFDGRQHALRDKCFVRSLTHVTISSLIFDAKGAFIIKYHFVLILTRPFELLFCSNNPGFFCFSVTFVLIATVHSLNLFFSDLFRIVENINFTSVL